MMYAPHRIYARVASARFDDRMNPIKREEDWRFVGNCRMDFNTTDKSVGVNERAYIYRYHIVHEGERIEAGSNVRVLDKDDTILCEGEVVKSSKCNFLSYNEAWI